MAGGSIASAEVVGQRIVIEATAAQTADRHRSIVGAPHRNRAQIGDGVRFGVLQDARGTHAESSADIDLAYVVAPIVAAAYDGALFAVAGRLRGASSLDLALESIVTVDVRDNPLNGITTVRVHGTAGYDPLTATLAARVGPFHGLRGFVAIEYARWLNTPEQQRIYCENARQFPCRTIAWPAVSSRKTRIRKVAAIDPAASAPAA